ncbi:MAG: glycosyltransferase [Candidatus Margulisiibacteriota bacterium]
MNKGTDPKLSVIIPTHNRERVLERVLDYLSNQKIEAPCEILVIDDGSEDNTHQMVKKFPLVRYFKYDKKGQSFARNVGIKESRGEILVFVDSDIFVKPDFLAAHLDYQMRFDRVLVQGPVIRIYDIERPFDARQKLSDFSSAFFDTCNSSIKKKHLLEAGYFDEEFTQYGWEDLELGTRIKNQGIKLKKNPKAVAYHLQKEFMLDSLDHQVEKEKARAAGAFIYYKKHPTNEVRLATHIGGPLHIIDKLFFNYFEGLKDKVDRSEFKRRMYLLHVYLKELRRIENG